MTYAHERYERLCALVSDGKLTADELTELRSHSMNCDCCGTGLEEFAALDRQIFVSFHLNSRRIHRKGLTERFIARAAREGIPLRRAMPQRSYVNLAGFAVTVLLALLLWMAHPYADSIWKRSYLAQRLNADHGEQASRRADSSLREPTRKVKLLVDNASGLAPHLVHHRYILSSSTQTRTIPVSVRVGQVAQKDGVDFAKLAKSTLTAQTPFPSISNNSVLDSSDEPRRFSLMESPNLLNAASIAATPTFRVPYFKRRWASSGKEALGQFSFNYRSNISEVLAQNKPAFLNPNMDWSRFHPDLSPNIVHFSLSQTLTQ